MTRIHRFSLLRATGGIVAAIVFVAASASAQAPRRDRISLEDYLEWENVQAPQLSPDGRTLLVTGNRRADAEYAFRDSEICAIDVAGGAIAPLTARKGPDGSPAWSPDGRLIAYTGYDDIGLDSTVSQLYVMNANGTGARSLTRTLDRSPGGLHWAADGSGVYFNADDQGTTKLYFAPLTGAVRRVTSGAHVLNTTDSSRGVSRSVSAPRPTTPTTSCGSTCGARTDSPGSRPSMRTCSPARSSRVSRRAGTPRRTGSRCMVGS